MVTEEIEFLKGNVLMVGKIYLKEVKDNKGNVCYSFDYSIYNDGIGSYSVSGRAYPFGCS